MRHFCLLVFCGLLAVSSTIFSYRSIKTSEHFWKCSASCRPLLLLRRSCTARTGTCSVSPVVVYKSKVASTSRAVVDVTFKSQAQVSKRSSWRSIPFYKTKLSGGIPGGIRSQRMNANSNDTCRPRNCTLEVAFSEGGTPSDYILLALAVAAAIPFIAANAALIVHRSRSYFHAQGGMLLILGNSLAGLVWAGSQFVTRGHLKKVGPLRICTLWSALQGIGSCLWFALTVLRLQRMYELSKGIEKWSWKYYALLALCVVPSVALFIVAAPSQSSKGEHPCETSKQWKIIGWSVYSVYWTFIIAAIYRLRNQQDPLLAIEYMHTLEYLAMALVISLLSSVTIITGASNTLYGRCFLTFSICCLVFVHFWVRFGWPVYLCLFRPKEDMDTFEQAMAHGGARALNFPYGERLNVPSSECAVWEAFSKASEELHDYQDEIRRLEIQKVVLKEKIKELRLEKQKVSGSA